MSQQPTTMDFPLLLPELERVRQQWDESTDASVAGLFGDGALAALRDRVLVCSPFFAESCRRYPELLSQLMQHGRLERSLDRQELAAELGRQLAQAPDESSAMAVLRMMRRREWMRVAWREISGAVDVMESLADLTAAADVLIQGALEFARQSLAGRHGTPRNRDGEEQRLVVLGMGKLGGGELNFSSDIDLVFLYPESGETDGPRPLSNEQFFTRLGQAVIRLLDQKTGEGFVFRVDMRLRPFGDGGPLVCTFAAFENYLQEQGRDWERYAYVKARALSGQSEGEWLRHNVLRPFVFRKYLDFGVFESLRSMKGMIEREVERRELQSNVKLGSGGIREIEFIAQVFQLLRGGNVPVLRERSLVPILHSLVSQGLLEPALADGLLDSYRFLRRVENLLQARADEQTHDLPGPDLERQRLVFAMGYRDWPTLDADICKHREFVQATFEEVVLAREARPADGEAGRMDGLWDQTLGEETARAMLEEMGVAEPQRFMETLAGMRGSALYRRLDETGRQRLDTLMRNVLRTVTVLDAPVAALSRLAGVLQSVGRRSAYFALLNENPGAMERLARICGRSEMLARQVAEHPLLLDELLDPRIFEAPPDRDQMAADLALRFGNLEPGDEEGQAEVLRQFQRATVFRIALAELGGVLPLMKISDRLTELAELILESVLSMVWSHMRDRYGEPAFVEDGQRRKAGYVVVGYGKLGGLELGYGSDLDLVFIHDSRGEDQRTDGDRSISNDVFFSRLTTRLVNLISMPTTSGVLYEVDMRLRPSGNAGLLVSSLKAFERYQQKEAWTWEHQALLRSRAVVGTPAVREEFERVRREVIAGSVRHENLRTEVVDMRRRMREELSGSKEGEFDIKQDTGGVADIEFLVQYLVLAHAHSYPELTVYSDNIRQLEALVATGLMEAPAAAGLKQAYLAFRGEMHEASLAGRKGVVDEGRFQAERSLVSDCWDRWMA